jgi:hypothetical protein
LLSKWNNFKPHTWSTMHQQTSMCYQKHMHSSLLFLTPPATWNEQKDAAWTSFIVQNTCWYHCWANEITSNHIPGPLCTNKQVCATKNTCRGLCLPLHFPCCYWLLQREMNRKMQHGPVLLFKTLADIIIEQLKQLQTTYMVHYAPTNKSVLPKTPLLWRCYWLLQHDMNTN